LKVGFELPNTWSLFIAGAFTSVGMLNVVHYQNPWGWIFLVTALLLAFGSAKH
jgi:hypothetical protein